VPPPNDLRRAQLTDAAIGLLAEAGAHGVTHRSVERRAGLPAGTASNYFRSREALLVATAERVIALHHGDMSAAPKGATAVELIAGSLLAAATTHRARYLAIFELRMESLRRPALAAALERLSDTTVAFTREHHTDHGLGIPPSAVATMVALYGGALFSLVSAPPGTVDEPSVRALAEAIVRSSVPGGAPDGDGEHDAEEKVGRDQSVRGTQ
jgi:AcrR family transcriptional regulator